MNENRNLILAVGLSVVIMLGFSQFYDKPKFEQIAQEQKANVAQPAQQAAAEPSKTTPVISPEVAIDQSARIAIATDTIQGSIRQVGAVLDDVLLVKYKETPDQTSPMIRLLQNPNGENGYSVSSGWKAANNCDAGSMPNDTTNWQMHGENTKLTAKTPITLVWFNDRGIKFERVISIDDQYMMTVTDHVTNLSDKEVSIQPTAQICRKNPPKSQGFFILHEGPIGHFNTKLFEGSYDDLTKSPVTQQSSGGWIGFTDKFWLVSLIPDPKSVVQVDYAHKNDAYTAQFSAAAINVKPKETSTYKYHVFAGAKVLRMLDGYESKVGVGHFDLAVDFGWFYFLTKPLFYALEFLADFLGNLGLAILALTILFKLILFPMATKSYRSMARLKNLQPKIQQIQNLYKNDRARLSQELMALYKKEKVNPAGGCLPVLIQAPIFFCLYKVLFVSIEMRHAPFFGWIHDLSAPDPTSFANLFGLLPFDPPSFLQIGIWPLLMGATMVIQQRMNPQPADPTQAKVMMIMPIMFTYLFASFPAGLVVYWTWNNLLSMAQQWFITKRMTQK
ncbi:MAG: membrane protein insertase YidC [Alphaproteobacteria bacterium]